MCGGGGGGGDTHDCHSMVVSLASLLLIRLLVEWSLALFRVSDLSEYGCFPGFPSADQAVSGMEPGTVLSQ